MIKINYEDRVAAIEEFNKSVVTFNSKRCIFTDYVVKYNLIT